MPERIFKYQTVDELVALAKSISQAITTGSTQELQNSHTGWRKRTGPLTIVELRNSIQAVRFEIYTRGQAGDTQSDTARCLAYEPTNPLQERVMRVESTYALPYFLTSPYGA
jgi:hypothetical protein